MPLDEAHGLIYIAVDSDSEFINVHGPQARYLYKLL